MTIFIVLGHLPLSLKSSSYSPGSCLNDLALTISPKRIFPRHILPNGLEVTRILLFPECLNLLVTQEVMAPKDPKNPKNTYFTKITKYELCILYILQNKN